MTDFVPRFGDVKTLKDLSKVFAFPVLAVAYILQSGLVISWGDKIWFDIGANLSESVQLNRFILIVMIKAIWASIFGGAAYIGLAFLHVFVWAMILPVAAMVLFTFGLLGLFKFGVVPKFESANAFWFYACFVWGFFLLNITEQFEASKS